MSVEVITAYGFELQARRRAIREQNLDLIFARIARQHAEKQSTTTAPIAAPTKQTPTISDEAFERVRRAAVARAGFRPASARGTARSDGDEAAEAILAAFRTFEPGTPDDRPPAGPATTDAAAAVAAIMDAFRTLSPSR